MMCVSCVCVCVCLVPVSDVCGVHVRVCTAARATFRNRRISQTKSVGVWRLSLQGAGAKEVGKDGYFFGKGRRTRTVACGRGTLWSPMNMPALRRARRDNEELARIE
jgi:hypothetical protein